MRPPRTALVIAAVALLGLPAVPGSTAGAQLPALADRIVFAGARNGGYDLLIMRPDGGDVENLTRSPGVLELDPAWSPDGTRIAFSRRVNRNTSPDIYVMRVTDGAQSRLTADFGGPIDRQPAWSPDGTRIAWTRSVHHRGLSQIFVMNADGSGARALTTAVSGRQDASPAWSPDGTRIAFVSDRGSGFPDLWVINADGSGRRRLARTPRIESDPAWSPDGTRIAFQRCCPGGTSDVFVMNSDGSGQKRLTKTKRHDLQPAWSPTGRRIVYSSFPRKGGNKDLYSVSATGGDVRRLTQGVRAEISPHWTGVALLPALLRQAVSPVRTAPAGNPSSGGSPSGSGSRKITTVKPGLKLVRRRFSGSDVYVLRVNPRRRTVDVALGGGRLPGRERTTSMVRRHGAIAAVNGDFPLPSGKPAHAFAEDGDLQTSSLVTSRNLAVSGGKGTARVAQPVEVLKVTERWSGDTWKFDRWNDGKATWGEVSAFSGAGGVRHGTPPRHACAARLLPSGPRRWGPSMNGVLRDFTVANVGCRSQRMPRRGGVVLAGPPGSVGGMQVASLKRGATVTLSWSFRWPGVADSVGGTPQLVRNGSVVAQPCAASICARHPRTGVGVTGKGRVLLVVVDGRRAGSRGLTLVQFARLFRDLGAASAVNLDGGGSSTMVVRGRIVNRPSDGAERAVSSAVLVLSGNDRRERIGAPGPAGAGGPPGRPSPRLPLGEQTGGRPLLDPASTGGLLDAMDRGLFGGRLPAELRSALRVFRDRR